MIYFAGKALCLGLPSLPSASTEKPTARSVDLTFYNIACEYKIHLQPEVSHWHLSHIYACIYLLSVWKLATVNGGIYGSFLRQRGYVFPPVYWLICLCAGLCKHYWMDYNETMWEDGELAMEDLIKFCYGSRKREDRGLFF